MKRRWSSTVHIEGQTGYLTLASADGESIARLFDADLAEEVAAHQWFPAANGEYAGYRQAGHRVYYLHWLALGLPGGHGSKIHVDHVNQNPNDSRRANLRIVRSRMNHHNQRRQSPLGVCIRPSARGYFGVRVRFGDTGIYHPAFRLLSDAHRCRDEYLAIAQAVDAGLRPYPDKAELKAISDRVRTVVPRKKRASRTKTAPR